MRRHHTILMASAAIAPWTWFAVRDRWPPLDTIGVVMPLIGLLCAGSIIVCVRARRPVLLTVALSTALVAITSILEPRLPISSPVPPVSISIVSANMFIDNVEPRQAAEDLVANSPDVIVAVEIPTRVRRAVERITPDHPFQAGGQEVWVRSRWPIRVRETPATVPPGGALLFSLTLPSSSPVTFLALHLQNPLTDGGGPGPTEQAEGIMRIRSEAERLAHEGPLVILGDLNLSDRTAGYRALSASFRDAVRIGAAARSTYAGGFWRFAMLRIDHIFVSPTWCASEPRQFEISGSDHRGIGASIGPCPPT